MIFRCQTSRYLLRATQNLRHTHSYHPSKLLLSHRALSTTPTYHFPRKDTQDRESLNPSSTEYSKSGSDDAAAANEDAAFNPQKTSPEQEKKTAAKDNDGNPLDVSPGNPEVSKPRDSQEGGAAKGTRNKASGGGSAPKEGGGQSG